MTENAGFSNRQDADEDQPYVTETPPDLSGDTAADSSRATVGEGDVRADAVRSGADDDTTGMSRDSDGVPVGDADADEDAIRSGADLE